MMESRPPAAEAGDMSENEDEEEDAPQWLVDAMKNSGARLRMEDSLNGIDIPPFDVGRDKPFKF